MEKFGVAVRYFLSVNTFRIIIRQMCAMPIYGQNDSVSIIHK